MSKCLKNDIGINLISKSYNYLSISDFFFLISEKLEHQEYYPDKFEGLDTQKACCDILQIFLSKIDVSVVDVKRSSDVLK